MKKLVWLAGAVLAFSLFFPNGISRPVPVTPVTPAVPAAEPDAKIVEILAPATAADKRRIVSVYTGLHTVLSRDAGQRVNTTEKFAELHANTLQMAIDKPGKYPGLGEAIDAVFKASVGTDDVLAVTGEVSGRLVKACETVIASAR